MIDFTGQVTLFGFDFFNIALSQLVLIMCVIVLLFLFILEAEFRQVRKLAKRMDGEELTLSKDLRELRDSVKEINEIVGQNCEGGTNDPKLRVSEATQKASS